MSNFECDSFPGSPGRRSKIPPGLFATPERGLGRPPGRGGLRRRPALSRGDGPEARRVVRRRPASRRVISSDPTLPARAMGRGAWGRRRSQEAKVSAMGFLANTYLLIDLPQAGALVKDFFALFSLLKPGPPEKLHPTGTSSEN